MMKKAICLFITLLFCLSMPVAVFASEFVPSIGVKDEPEIVPPVDEGDVIGLIRDKNGEIIDYVHEHCLVITPVSKANTSKEIPEDAKDLLLSVYADLTDGSMQIPYEKLDLDPEKMVIRDLIDATFLCEEHPEMLVPEGVVLELIFDLGVSADTDVYVMTYKNGEWNPIVSVVNNGDGTVTCVFEHLCPIAFSVESSTIGPPAQTGDSMDITLWVVLLVISAVALVAIVIMRRKATR